MATFQQFLGAIRMQESTNDYKRVNSSSGALGAYQVMPSNLSPWLKDAGLPQMTPQQFLANPSAQDAVAAAKLKPYFDKFGPAGAAAWWYSGQTDPNKTYGSPPVKDYVKQVLARIGTAPPVTGSTQSGSSSGVQNADITGDIGGMIGDGISKGLLQGFLTIITPGLEVAWWMLETFLGIGLAIFAIFLLAQQNEQVRNVEKKTLEAGTAVAAPEAEAAEVAGGTEATTASKRVADGTKTQQQLNNAEFKKRNAAAQRRFEKARVADAERRMKEARGSDEKRS